MPASGVLAVAPPGQGVGMKIDPATGEALPDFASGVPACRMSKPAHVCDGPGKNGNGQFCNDQLCPVNTRGVEVRRG